MIVQENSFNGKETSEPGQPVAGTRQISAQVVLVGLALGLIILLGAFLRFYALGANSIGNSYYAATVQSMLLSWHNFFFAAFEPGGSVTVDKPPLGFWLQAVSAYFLGVNGFALALPQALAGVFSLPLLYWLVRRHFGAAAGLLAALALAVIPVTVSTERNNTIDGLLVFVLLLAAWAVLEAVERGKLRFLLLGAFLVGVGFNIKMLQAYMILPGLYGLYFLGARQRWWLRLLHLTGATVLLLAVSLWWVVLVDMIPPDERPYIGSSSNNTVMELITGHNGIRRLVSSRPNNISQVDNPAPQQPRTQDDRPGALPVQPGQIGPQDDNPPVGSGMARTQGPGANAPGGSGEVGVAGALRLFTQPLANEAAWLLPVALLGIPLILSVLGWAWPLRGTHLGLVLWAGWLLPEALYFSFTTGLFHAYYLIMLGPPVAALVGATSWALWQVYERKHWLGWVSVVMVSLVTLAAQTVPLQTTDSPARALPQAANTAQASYVTWILAVAGGLCLLGVFLLAWRVRPVIGKIALALVCLSLVIAPLAWSALTTFNNSPNVMLPRAGPNAAPTGPTGGHAPNDNQVAVGIPTSPRQQKMIEFLLANTDPEDYLLATSNANQAAPYILLTKRPVLTFGGFSGSDNVISVEKLRQMVSTGELRFVLGGNDLQQKAEIAAWVRSTCKVVHIPGITASGMPVQPIIPPRQQPPVHRPGAPQIIPPGVGLQQPIQPGAPGQSLEVLYDCVPQG